MSPNLFELSRAVTWLSDFVTYQAAATARRVGFGWQATDDAPNTFTELEAEALACAGSGRALRVATVNADPTIFSGPEVNHAMRFWHDITHVELGQDFGLAGEMRVADAHLTDLGMAGQPRGSLPWALLRADTAGQNLVFAMTGGGFVADQWQFALACVENGLPLAVLQAVEDIDHRSIEPADVRRLSRLMVNHPAA